MFDLIKGTIFIRSPWTTTEQVKISPVSITTSSISSVLLEGLHDGHTSKVNSDFTLLDSKRSLLCALEVDDSEATIFEIVTHLHWHEATLNRAELLNDCLNKIFFSNAAWDVSELDSSGVRYFLLFLCLFHCFFGYDGFHVEDALLGLADLSGGVLVLTLIFLQVLHSGLQVSNFVTLHVSVPFLRHLVTHLSTEILLPSLDLEVGMPHVVSVEHSDVLVTTDGVSVMANAKRVENWVFEGSFSVTLCHCMFRLQDASVEVLDNGTRVFELSFLDCLAQLNNFRLIFIGNVQSVDPLSEPSEFLSLGFVLGWYFWCYGGFDHLISLLVCLFN